MLLAASPRAGVALCRAAFSLVTIGSAYAALSYPLREEMLRSFLSPIGLPDVAAGDGYRRLQILQIPDRLCRSSYLL